MIFKLTPELVYILLDRCDHGPLGNKNNDQLVIGNYSFGRNYSKTYRMNNDIVNFRTLWKFLSHIRLEYISHIVYNDRTYQITNGTINISVLDGISNKQLLSDLLYRIRDTGSQEGDEATINEIFKNFVDQNL